MAEFKVNMIIDIPDELLTESGGVHDPEESGSFATVKEFVEHEIGWIFPVNYLEKVEVIIENIKKEVMTQTMTQMMKM